MRSYGDAKAMKDTLAPGVAGTRRQTIDRERTIDFMGETLRVYSTPSMLRDIEHTCRDIALEHLDGGEDTVGVRVELDHLGATLLDSSVEITARVTGVEGAADPVRGRCAGRARRDGRAREAHPLRRGDRAPAPAARAPRGAASKQWIGSAPPRPTRRLSYRRPFPVPPESGSCTGN